MVSKVFNIRYNNNMMFAVYNIKNKYVYYCTVVQYHVFGRLSCTIIIHDKGMFMVKENLLTHK